MIEVVGRVSREGGVTRQTVLEPCLSMPMGLPRDPCRVMVFAELTPNPTYPLRYIVLVACSYFLGLTYNTRLWPVMS